MNFNYDEFFRLPLRAMNINGCHPNVRRDKRWFIHLILPFSIFTMVFLLIMYNITLNLKSKEFDLTCKNGVFSVVYFVVSFQLFIMLWKQDLLLTLMTLMRNDYAQAKSLPLHEQEIMYKYAKKGTYVCKQWFIISCCACGIFPLKNIVLLTYQCLIGEPKLIPIYDLVYPGIIEEYKGNVLVYLALYALMLSYGLYAMCMYTAFVPLGPICMLHICGQLEIVEKKIDVVFKGGIEVEAKLKNIIIQLQYVYSFAEKIISSFRVNYELTLKATTIILPITCYEVIEAFHQGEVSLEFITFIVGGILISSSPCYYSDLLMEKGENVRIAMYSSGWTSVYDLKIRRTVGIILTRALKPVAIRTLFRTVCLEALTDLFQQSYTIYNLMNAMWK